MHEGRERREVASEGASATKAAEVGAVSGSGRVAGDQGRADRAGGTGKDRAAGGTGKKRFDFHKAQVVTQLAVLVAVLGSLAFDLGLGTPSSFGVGEFFLLCPLGALESFAASRSFLPITLVSFVVVVVLSLLFGRFWCAWGCPAPAIRRFFRRDPRSEEVAGSPQGEGCLADLPIASSPKAARACGGVRQAAFSLGAAFRHVGRDRRTWVLLAVLAAACVAGFPIFCLVCPIGLTYGTVASLWHFIVDKQTTLSLLVFPAALAVELVLYRKWCASLCPVAGFLGVVGQFARMFRPQIKADTCKNYHGEVCKACTLACPEGIDKHALRCLREGLPHGFDSLRGQAGRAGRLRPQPRTRLEPSRGVIVLAQCRSDWYSNDYISHLAECRGTYTC